MISIEYIKGAFGPACGTGFFGDQIFGKTLDKIDSADGR
jgi:hypothetical protein